MPPVEPSRRQVLATVIGAALVGCRPDPRTPLFPGEGSFAGGDYLGDVEIDDKADPTLEALEGEGLDARRRIDIAELGPDRLTTPLERFYVRTLTPSLPAEWAVSFEGMCAAPFQLATAQLPTLSRDAGDVLLECAGNGNGEKYGLMSCAAWSGVPLAPLLEQAGPTPESRVLVEGWDPDEVSPRGSRPGCSWIFTVADLADAVLATGLAGQPLSAAHGGPVRLLVPGWYGCANPKWVRTVRFVPDDAPVTTQMKEYAVRTHQDGVPDLARNYRSARQGISGVAVRVERWRISAGERFRVVGLRWGGERPVDGLEIRFDKDEPWSAITWCPTPSSVHAWSPWWHDWSPTRSGKHSIQLRCTAPGADTRRLDTGWYTRRVSV